MLATIRIEGKGRLTLMFDKPEGDKIVSIYFSEARELISRFANAYFVRWEEYK